MGFTVDHCHFTHDINTGRKLRDPILLYPERERQMFPYTFGGVITKLKLSRLTVKLSLFVI